MINIAELRNLTETDSQGADKLLKPILDFCDYLAKKKGLTNDTETHNFLVNYMVQYNDELKKEFEGRKEINALDFAEISIIPLNKLCDEMEYEHKSILIERYKYLIASILMSQGISFQPEN